MRRFRLLLPVVVLAVVVPQARFAGADVSQQAQPPAQTETHPELPTGAGREQLIRVCSGCHLMAVITAQHKNEDGWISIVGDMRSRGAKGSDEDFEQIAQYLITNLGPAVSEHININTTTADAMVANLGITKAGADAIVKWRTEKGPFKSIETLQEVPGVDASKIASAKDRIDF